MEREDGDISLRARVLLMIVGADRVGRVAHHNDASQLLHHRRCGLEHGLNLRLVDQLHDGVVVAGPASNVHRDDGLCLGCDGLADGVNRYVQVLARVHHHGLAASPQHSQGSGAIGVGRHDDLVARLDAQPAKHQDGTCCP